MWVGDADSADEFHESAHRIIESVRTGMSPLGLITDFIDEAMTILGKRKVSARIPDGFDLFTPQRGHVRDV